MVTQLRLAFVDVEENTIRRSWIGWGAFSRTMTAVSEDNPVHVDFEVDAERLKQYWEQPTGPGMRVHT